MHAPPRYDDLPIASGTTMRHAWGVFGPDDQLGTLNRLTEEARREAAAGVRLGRAVDLTLPLTEPDPAPFGRRQVAHSAYALDALCWDDRLTNLDLQGSTQWDGFRHVRHRRLGFYGGALDDPGPGGTLGIDQWVAHGVAGRGVLLDVGAHLSRQDPSYDPLALQKVTATVLRDVAERQGVRLRSGDILCLRFGWTDAFRRADPSLRHRLAATTTCAGLSATEETARFLWDSGVAAVAADNPSVEAVPGDRDDGYLHHRLLTMLGMPLGELFSFDELASQCAAQGRWDFLFVSVPLNLPGAIGSPGNALALL